MKYSQQTQDLINRMCRNVERPDFVLEKEKAEECLLKTYDLFDLPRPKKIVWCKDNFEENFASSTSSAWSAWSARSARSASSAWSTSSASSAWSAWSTSSAWSAWSTSSAWSAWSTSSASSAWSARSARSAIDYDFDWFVIEHEYCINRKDNPGNDPNENDRKYLEYSELLMQAKEYGLGYRVELKDTLYLAPTPLVLLDNQNRFHSEVKPAIRWKEGTEIYFLHGVKMEQELHQQIVAGRMTFSEILKIKNSEQQLMAMRYNPHALMLENPKLLSKTGRDNELYVIENSEANKIYDAKEVYILRFRDPSKNPPHNWMIQEVNPELCKLTKNADDIMAFHSYQEIDPTVNEKNVKIYQKLYKDLNPKNEA